MLIQLVSWKMRLKFFLNHTEGFYVQSVSISYVEGRFCAAVVFNAE